MTEQQKAFISEIEGAKETAVSPTTYGDKCFLCSQQIGESDPRGFFTGKNGNTVMMLAHRGCLNKLEVLGGDPKDFARADEKPEAAVSAEGSFGATVSAQVTPTSEPLAMAHIKFESFEHMQSFIQNGGHIPDKTKVSIGDQVIRE